MITILSKQFTDHGIRELIIKDKSVKNLKSVWNHLRKNKVRFNARVEFSGSMQDRIIKSDSKLSDFVKELEISLEKFSFLRISFFVEEGDLDKIKIEKSYSDHPSSPKPWLN